MTESVQGPERLAALIGEWEGRKPPDTVDRDMAKWLLAHGLSLPDSGDALRAEPRYNQPNNVVACVSCKRPVHVSALNAIRCEQCKEPSAPWALLEAIRPFTVLVEAEIERLTREEETNLHAITVCLVTQRLAQGGNHEKLEYATELGHVTVGDLLLLQALYRKTVPASAPDGLRDRDALWCKALIATLDSEEVETTLRWFNEHRPDAARAALGSAPRETPE